MRQAGTHESVKTNLCILRGYRPRHCDPQFGLIRHTYYRTLPRDLLNKDRRMTSNSFSVIIAGGKGTRFWPLSRAGRPKQLLKILSRKSLIDETAERVHALGGRKQT